MNKREKRGIYNVTFNEKNATSLNLEFEKDIRAVENAIIQEVVMYVKGHHQIRSNKGFGAKHIKYRHIGEGKVGEIKLEELLNLGVYLRKYMEIFKEPYLENTEKTGKLFEWQDENGVRFRVSIDKKEMRDESERNGGSHSDRAHFLCVIISFYSDRNLKNKTTGEAMQMAFKNPKVREFYEKITEKR